MSGADQDSLLEKEHFHLSDVPNLSYLQENAWARGILDLPESSPLTRSRSYPDLAVRQYPCLEPVDVSKKSRTALPLFKRVGSFSAPPSVGS